MIEALALPPDFIIPFILHLPTERILPCPTWPKLNWRSMISKLSRQHARTWDLNSSATSKPTAGTANGWETIRSRRDSPRKTLENALTPSGFPEQPTKSEWLRGAANISCSGIFTPPEDCSSISGPTAGRLKQAYSVQRVRREAVLKGYHLQEQKTPQGTIRLTMTPR